MFAHLWHISCTVKGYFRCNLNKARGLYALQMSSLKKYFYPAVFTSLVLLSLSASALQPQRFRTYFLDFKPISVGDTADKELVIDGFMNSGMYAIQKPLEAPFILLTQEQDLAVRNGQLRINVRFAPVINSTFASDLILIWRPGFPQTPDTLRIRATGASYYVKGNDLIDFGRVLTGLVKEDSIKVRREPENEDAWFAVPPGKPNPPFFLVSLGTNITPSVDSAFVVFRFAPARKGVFRDTVRLIRRHQGMSLDTITVYLVGIGVDLDTTMKLSFGAVLTGDSVMRRRVFLQPPTHIYEIEYIPDDRSAFNVYKEKLTQGDSVAVVISFSPVKQQAYSDSLVLRRMKAGSAGVFDRIVIYLAGEGAGMQQEDRVNFTGVRVNDVMADSTVIALNPNPINTEFLYKLNRIQSGYIEGTITTPLGATKADIIIVKFLSSPKAFVNTSEKFVLYRMSISEKMIDSTVIDVVTTMSARPLKLSLKVEEDTMRMRIGETLPLRLLLTAVGEVDKPIGMAKITGRIAYNPTVVVPRLTDGVKRIIDGDRVYIEYTSAEGSVVVNDEPNVVAVIGMMAVIGDTDRTSLALTNWFVVTADATYPVDEITSGMVLITNPWRYANGNSRFVNSLQGALKLDISPNPMVSGAVMRVDNVQPGVGELTIVDVNGTLVADLTQQLRSGIREFELNQVGGSGVLLNAGSYYVRLQVRGDNGNSINKVVRLLIVQ